MSTVNPSPPTYATAGGRDHPEILVALEHARLVEHQLGRAGAPPARRWDSAQLGLARFRFEAAAVQRFAQEQPALYADDTGLDVGEAQERLDEKAHDQGGEPAGELLCRLRAHFRDRYAGWAPTMGKNRLVAQVQAGGGTVSHGGGPDPVPARAPLPRAGRDGEGVVVGVLDTALAAHPAFAGRRLAAVDVLDRRDSYPFAAGHATFVAGLVWEQAPGATVRAAEVLDQSGQATSWDVANEIVRLGLDGVDVLNLAFVCYTADGRAPLALATAVDRLHPDVLVVACAGNHGDPDLGLTEDQRRQPSWPAALDDVVAVGSADRSPGGGYQLSPFTPRDAPWVDVVTQGQDVASTYLTGRGPDGSTFEGGARWSGTSFSAARLAGRVAAHASVAGVPVRQAFQSLVGSLESSQPGERGWQPPFLDLSEDG